MLETPREDDVAVEPGASRGNLRKRHANLKGDARLLRQDAHRPVGTHRRHYSIEERSNRRRLPFEVMREGVASAGV